MKTPEAVRRQITVLRVNGESLERIAEISGCAILTVRRILAGAHDPDNALRLRTRHVPDDFAERAPHMTCADAIRVWKCSNVTVYKWAAICGFVMKSKFREVPDDFEALYRVTTKRVLEAHYQASYSTVKRWGSKMPADARAEHDAFVRAAIGDGARERWAVVNAAKPPKPVKVKRTPGRGVTWGNAKAVPIPEAKADIVSMAMRALQRIYAPVYRAETVAGKAAIGLFKVGRMTMTEPELLALAARKAGFTFSEGFAG